MGCDNEIVICDNEIVMDVSNDCDMIWFELMNGDIVRIVGLNQLRTNRDVIATFRESSEVNEIVITCKVMVNE